MIRKAPPLLLALLSFGFLWSAASAHGADDQKTAPNLPISSLTQGPPELMTQFLGEKSYQKIPTQRLTQARVLWLNFPLLQEMGIKVPLEGMTPDFEQEVLNALAYSIPRRGDDPSLFTDDRLDVYADRYGGLGMNGNLGSGRAASAGKVQIKGVGITPLVGPRVSDFGHAHGGASLNESVHEAIWGEILHRELPHGANRMIAILSTGTYTEHEGWREPRALAVRVDPLRPAHFLRNESVEGQEAFIDTERVSHTIKSLGTAFAPDTKKANETDAETIRRGMKDFIRKSAEQYAASYAKRFFHGATSPSNFLTHAGMIDYGTETSLPDYQPLKVLADEGPFGDIGTQKSDLLAEIFTDLKQTLPKTLRTAVPTAHQAGQQFDRDYHKTLRKTLLALTGAPEPLIEEIAGQKVAEDLGNLIERVATAGLGDVVQLSTEVLRHRSTYRLDQILAKLGTAGGTDDEKNETVLRTLIPDPDLRAEFANTYAKFRKRIREKGRVSGFQPSAIDTFIRHASSVRNRTLPELFIGPTHWSHVEASVKQAMERDPFHGVQNYIDRAIETNTRNFRDTDGFQVVVRNHEENPKGYSRRRIFDARQNRMVEQVKFAVRDGDAEVFGTKRNTNWLGQSSLSGTFSKGQGHWKADAHLDGRTVSYAVPVNEDEEVNITHLERTGNQPLPLGRIPEFQSRPVENRVICQFHLLQAKKAQQP